jgi:hypothetical protein
MSAGMMTIGSNTGAESRRDFREAVCCSVSLSIVASTGVAPKAAPHFEQNLAPGRTGALHDGHFCEEALVTFAPHSVQNFAFSGIGALQEVHLSMEFIHFCI